MSTLLVCVIAIVAGSLLSFALTYDDHDDVL